MKSCRDCGTLIKDGAQYCESCATSESDPYEQALEKTDTKDRGSSSNEYKQAFKKANEPEKNETGWGSDDKRQETRQEPSVSIRNFLLPLFGVGIATYIIAPISFNVARVVMILSVVEFARQIYTLIKVKGW